MEEEKKNPNNNKTSEHIKKISQKLRDKQYLCDPDIGDVFEIFDEFYREGESSTALFGVLCDNRPDLRGISTADEEELLRVLKAEKKRQKKVRGPKLREQQINDTAEIMEDLKQRYRFITAKDTRAIYYYKDGIFEEATTLIEAEVEAHFNDTNSTYFTNEIINHLRRETYTDRDKFNADKTHIPLKNGLFNLETFELEPFDENKIFTFRIPIAYNPKAECPNIVAWIKEIVNPDGLCLLQEFCGYGFEPQFPLHKTLWLHGSGRNGKGAYMRLYTKAIGGQNRSSVPLEQMTAKFRFVLIRLLDKFINVCSEPQSNYVFQTETFKKISGGDEIDGEIKGLQKTISFTVFARLFIMGNTYPNINDNTTGFWERMEIVSFPKDYSENFITGIEDKKINEDGGEEQALAGFFNWCMEGLKRLKENNYKLSKSKSGEEKRLEFEKVSNSVRAFITECVTLKSSEKYTQPALWNDYKEYCDRCDLQIQQKSVFTSRIGELRGVRLGGAKIDGKKQRVWFGLVFRNCEEGESVEEIEEHHEEEGGQSDQSGQNHIPTHGKKNINNNNIIGGYIAKTSTLSSLSTSTKEEKTRETTISLVCVCGKRFDTIEVLRHHQAKCRDFQAKQSKEAEQTLHTADDTKKLDDGDYGNTKCPRCGKNAVLIFYNNQDVCSSCLSELKEEEKNKKDKPTKTVNIDDIEEDGGIKLPGAIDKKEEVGELIKSFVIDATKEDDRGAMIVAMANRIANGYLYEKAEVKAEIDRLVQEGELLISEDDYGEYVKVVCKDGCCELTKFMPSPNLDEDECSQCGDVLMCEWQIEEGGEWLPICQSCKLAIQEQER